MSDSEILSLISKIISYIDLIDGPREPGNIEETVKLLVDHLESISPDEKDELVGEIKNFFDNAVQELESTITEDKKFIKKLLKEKRMAEYSEDMTRGDELLDAIEELDTKIVIENIVLENLNDLKTLLTTAIVDSENMEEKILGSLSYVMSNIMKRAQEELDF
ncbi:MAG: hypothetical protein J7L47_01090 [Candidatus Odinarchaeota archaeon]|nr:hypothetical protein [Candidatus Odinarchaeota archaeon]